jgi:hypothetical protein
MMRWYVDEVCSMKRRFFRAATSSLEKAFTTASSLHTRVYQLQ